MSLSMDVSRFKQSHVAGRLGCFPVLLLQVFLSYFEGNDKPGVSVTLSGPGLCIVSC